MVLTSSSSSATSHLLNIPWERVSWLFFRLSICLFFSRSLSCLESFYDSFECFWPLLMQLRFSNWLPWEPSNVTRLEPGSVPWDLALFWVSFGHAHAVQLPFLANMRTILSEWTGAWWPPWSCFWPALTWLIIPAWLSWEPSDLSWLDPYSLPWLANKFPLEFPLRFIVGQSPHIYILYTVQFSLFLLVEYSVPFIHSFPIIVISVFWSWNCILGILIPKLGSSQ